jgi:hypothetical protein
MLEPPDFQQLIQNVVGVDGNLERKKVLTELLVNYTDIISSGSHDLGRTKLVKQTIDTGDAAPKVKS